MDVLMVAAELGPYARATEAGDAIPSLAKALRQLGHRVTVALPRYGAFEAHGVAARRLTPRGRGREVNVYDGQPRPASNSCCSTCPAYPSPWGSAPRAVGCGRLGPYLAPGERQRVRAPAP